jgi:hypothetical protein
MLGHRVHLQVNTNVSEKHAASIFKRWRFSPTLMMEAVYQSETLVSSTRLHGVTTYETKTTALKTSDTLWIIFHCSGWFIIIIIIYFGKNMYYLR